MSSCQVSSGGLGYSIIFSFHRNSDFSFIAGGLEYQLDTDNPTSCKDAQKLI